MDSLNRQIALLEDSLLPEGTKLSAAAGYRSDAMKKLSEIRAGIRTGNWTGLKDAGDEMLISLNRYAALLSSEEGIRQTLAVLQDQRNAMLNGECRTTVNDSASGYYYDKSAVDGLESIFRTQELETLTGERFEQLKRAAPLSEDGFHSLNQNPLRRLFALKKNMLSNGFRGKTEVVASLVKTHGIKQQFFALAQ